MAFFDFLRRRRAPETHGIAGLIPVWDAGRPLSPTGNYSVLVDDGYRRNAVVFACINEIATSLAEPPVLCGRGAEFDPLPETHPLAMLLARPAPGLDWSELLDQSGRIYGVAGECFFYKNRNPSGVIVELCTLRPDRMKHIADTSGAVVAWEYSVDGVTKERIDAADVIHVKAYDPGDDFRGLSPIDVAARMGDLDNHAGDYMRALFENGGIPGTAIKVKGRATENERRRVQQKFRDDFSGARGWHAAAVVDEDVEIERLGLDPNSLNLEPILSVTESRICAAFQVPPILVGVKVGLDRSTFANYGEARQSFWRETMAPLFRKFSSKLTAELAVEFGGDCRIAFDFDAVPALQESTDAVHTRTRENYKEGLITLNEARAEIGLEPVTDGDTRRDPMGFDVFAETESQARRVDAIAAETGAALRAVK